MKVTKVNQNSILLESLIGKTLEESNILCGHNGFTTRVSKQDGVNFIITRELKLTRINLELQDGIVTKASIG